MTNSCKEVPNYKLITPAVVSERLKIRGSLARAALQELLSKGLIKLVSKHRAQVIYTETPRGGMPQLLVKMHEQVPPAVHFENKTLLNQKRKAIDSCLTRMSLEEFATSHTHS